MKHNEEEKAPADSSGADAADQVLQHSNSHLLMEEMSVTEHVRFTQLRRGLTSDQIREILVQWVGGSEEEGAGRK